MTLEEEAKEYCEKWALIDSIADIITDFVIESKYVQAEKIKAQIEILDRVYYLSVSPSNSDELVKEYREELTQQLKNLEDETSTN